MAKGLDEGEQLLGNNRGGQAEAEGVVGRGHAEEDGLLLTSCDLGQVLGEVSCWSSCGAGWCRWGNLDGAEYLGTLDGAEPVGALDGAGLVGSLEAGHRVLELGGRAMGLSFSNKRTLKD